MAQRRWQPPPMQQKSDKPESKLSVDERVVRKMLKVNPDMRKGRTTFQVKKALEGGEAVGAKQATPATTGSPPAAPAGKSTSTELQETIDFFVRGKSERLQALLNEVAEQRKSVDQHEQQGKAELAQQLQSFIKLLDEKAVATHGRSALAKHASFLKQLGLTPADLLRKIGNKS